MVSIALVDARKTSLMGVQNSKKIGSPLRGLWTMLRIVVGSNPPPPLGKKLDPPLSGVIETVISPVAISRIERLSGAGGAGVTRFSVVVDSMAFFFFYNTNTYLHM